MSKKVTPDDREERVYAAGEMKLELREATVEGKKNTQIRGYAAVFDKPTRIWDFDEIIDKRAFDAVLKKNPDTRALFNHDSNFVLGRTKSGTLKLSVDNEGLFTETDPPKTPIADSIVESIRRGDVDGMSFAFTVSKARWEFSEDPAVPDKRYILEVGQLYDVGPVTFPAYPQTSVAVQENAKQMHNEARAQYREMCRSSAESRSAEGRSDDEVCTGFVECRSADGEVARAAEWRKKNETRAVTEEAQGAPEAGAEKKGEASGGEEKRDAQSGTAIPANGEQQSAETHSATVAEYEIAINQRYGGGNGQRRYS